MLGSSLSRKKFLGFEKHPLINEHFKLKWDPNMPELLIIAGYQGISYI
jgi:hypothetical protein